MMTHKRLPLAALLAATSLTAAIAAFTTGAACAAEAYAASDKAFSRSLNGDWSFRYLPATLPAAVPGVEADASAGFTARQFDSAAWRTIAVPSNWELQGFAEPSYGDDLKDGTGLYRRTFRVPADWRGRRAFLRFEGVAFGYEVWVNGGKAGQSSASAFNRHTFDVTGLVEQEADNVVAVRVATKPHGVEFDLNDDWSLSGIYRDVTLFSVPATHVQDGHRDHGWRRTARRRTGGGRALSRADGEVRARLLAPDGGTAADIALPAAPGERRAGTIRVAQPKLWTAETPSLYRLQLTVSTGGKVLQTGGGTRGPARNHHRRACCC
jgi:beta-galactosidase